MENLPPIQGYSWRGIQPADAPLLDKFEKACAAIDGATRLKQLADWAALASEPSIDGRSVIAVNAQGQIALGGWFEVDERVENVLAFLEGRVHPDFRGHGYGTVLLHWLETQAALQMRAGANGRACIYRLMFYDRAPDASALFEARGYRLQYIEQEMQRELKPPWPDSSHPDLTFEPWATDNRSDYYAVYRAAFSSRTDHLMPAEAWHSHFANPYDDDFQPGLSLLARQSGNPAAYAVIHTEEAPDDSPARAAWVTQTGVHTGYRRQGIGSALLIETMKQLHQAGFQRIKLSVNVDNAEAVSLYVHLGFSVARTLTMYYRPLNA